MNDSTLTKRLHAIQRTVRRRLVAYGLCAVPAGGAASFLTVVALDYLLWLPAVLRMVVAVLFFSGFVAATMHWIVTPLRVQLSIDQIAARLERHFGNLHDELSSTVSFLKQSDAGSPSMVRRVIRDTDRNLRDLPLESALTLKPLLSAATVLGIAGLLLTAVLATSTSWAQTGLYRYVYPFGSIEWPRNTMISPITGMETVAVGESVTVKMAVLRGLHQELRGVVHLRGRSGEVMSLTMKRDDDGVFFTTVDAVTENLTYWFEAGDDSTERSPFVIRVVRRPEVVAALARIEPPPYASLPMPRTQDLGRGPVSAPIGGTVTVNLQSSKPINPSAGRSGESVGLRLESDELIPLEIDEADRTRLTARLAITGDLRFRAELVDDDGFSNRGAATYAIAATPDAPPTVNILEPQADVELMPQAILSVVCRAEDDFGIANLEWHFERTTTGETQIVSLLDLWSTTTKEDGVEGIAQYSWNMQSLSVKPGEVLNCTAVATDNRVGEESTGQTGRSASLRVKIISGLEFDVRVHDDLAQIEGVLRQIVLEQAELFDQTQRLKKDAEPTATLSETEREQSASLASKESRLARRLKETAGRAATLYHRMEQNHAGDESTRGQIAALGLALQQIAVGSMTQAGVALSRVAETTEAVVQQTGVDEASRLQEETSDRLRVLLRSMTQWGDFQGLVSKTRDLLDRQREVRSQTVELGKSMLGKPVESLTEAEAADLKRAQRQQEQVAADVEQLLKHMDDLLRKSREKDPSGAEAIDAALRAARSQDVQKRLRTAIEAIETNRTAAAVVDQQAAADAMQRMVGALRERENRQLALLKKQVQSAEEQVAALLETQRGIRAATHEAGLVGAGADGYRALEEQQHGVRGNTRLLGDELADSERLAAMGRQVRDAAVPMADAEARLHDQRAEPAVAAQDKALLKLEEALAQLESLAQEMAEQSMRRSLEQIREELQAMLDLQRGVNVDIVELRKTMEPGGRANRSTARAASKLARQQTEIRRMLDDVRPEMEKVPVYSWALKRVGEWMNTTRDWLEARKLDDDLVDVTERIARELERLIRAIRDTEALPMDTEFAEAESDGGAGGQGSSSGGKPIPTVAELMVLRSMQLDINARTEALRRAMDIDRAEERQLRELKTIGEDQTQVRRLAEMVTAKSRQP